MKKTIVLVLMLTFMSLMLMACGSDSKTTNNNNEVKDVSMLLSGIGGDLSSIQSLGQLPEPQVAGQRYYYDTKDVEGYFNGYNLGIEVSEDKNTVTQIYIEPYEANNVKVNGLIIGNDIADANELYGKGELSSEEKNGKVLTYMTYQDDNYNIKCTVTNNQVSAVSFSLLESRKNKNSVEKTAENNNNTDSTTEDSNKSDNEDEEKEPINLSIHMTKDEIINKLGDDYSFTTYEDGGYFMYYSLLEYDGITFTFYHDNEKITGDSKIDWVKIESNKYTFDYDIKIGDNAREVLTYCEENYKNAYNHHGDEDIFGMYEYREKETNSEMAAPILKFDYSEENLNIWDCSSVEDIGKDVIITGISIEYFLD